MRTLWRLSTLLLAGTAGAIVAAATSVSLTTTDLGAASVAMPRCAITGLTVLQNLAAATVVSVTVGALPSTCGGATLQLTVDNGATSSGGSGSVPAGGGSLTITLAAAVAVTASERTDVVVVGP